MDANRGIADRWAEKEVDLLPLTQAIMSGQPIPPEDWNKPFIHGQRAHHLKDMDEAGAVAGAEEPLSRKFRRIVREMMLDKEIENRIKLRVMAELSGEEDMRLTIALVRVAAGNLNPGGQRQIQDPGWRPQLNIHLEKLTDEQLKAFIATGQRPEGMPIVEVPRSMKKLTKGGS